MTVSGALKPIDTLVIQEATLLMNNADKMELDVMISASYQRGSALCVPKDRDSTLWSPEFNGGVQPEEDRTSTSPRG
jgi:hypothetical protein